MWCTGMAGAAPAVTAAPSADATNALVEMPATNADGAGHNVWNQERQHEQCLEAS